jgi:succinate-semialdehyde dehydrogenase/glutarate-semialdehyde dehydrogenase
LLKWDSLIRENRDDLANIVTYETGKPLSESQGELDYALGFTWWFAGEAERVQGTVQVPAAPGRRVFTIKQPIGVAVALVPWNFPGMYLDGWQAWHSRSSRSFGDLREISTMMA